MILKLVLGSKFKMIIFCEKIKELVNQCGGLCNQSIYEELPFFSNEDKKKGKTHSCVSCELVCKTDEDIKSFANAFQEEFSYILNRKDFLFDLGKCKVCGFQFAIRRLECPSCGCVEYHCCPKCKGDFVRFQRYMGPPNTSMQRKKIVEVFASMRDRFRKEQKEIEEQDKKMVFETPQFFKVTIESVSSRDSQVFLIKANTALEAKKKASEIFPENNKNIMRIIAQVLGKDDYEILKNKDIIKG